MSDYIISLNEGELMYRRNGEDLVLVSSAGVDVPAPEGLVIPPSTNPPWHTATTLATFFGEGTYYDVSTDPSSDLAALVEIGGAVQGPGGLQIPSGSPHLLDGFWRCGDKSLADYLQFPAAMNASVIIRKDDHTSALAGSRLFGWATEDGQSYLMVGIRQGSWVMVGAVNGVEQVATIGSANNATAQFITGRIYPFGTTEVQLRAEKYALQTDILSFGGSALNAPPSGAPSTAGSPSFGNVDEWLQYSLTSPDEWWPTIWIDGYNMADNPVSFIYANV